MVVAVPPSFARGRWNDPRRTLALARLPLVGKKRYAARLLPIVEHQPHHQLLVTLLLCNSIFNETLPLFLDNLVPSWVAIIISVTAPP